MRKTALLLLIGLYNVFLSDAQTIKILFDATKAETANNADWVIDSDKFNLGFNSSGVAVVGSGTEANPQRIPTPAQSGITATTDETYWTGALSAWGVDCAKRGYVVETLPYNGAITYGNSSNAQDLSNYQIYIVCEPNISFTSTEKTAIINFVKNGGGLFMVSDHDNSDRNGDGVDSPTIWNDLMSSNTVQANPFGITFDLSSFSQTSSNVATLPTDSILHGPMGNVSQVAWYSGTSMTLSKTNNASVSGKVFKTGSSTTGTTGVLFATARYGKGKVAAIGDSSPCEDGTGDSNDNTYNGYFQDANGNHQLLLMNATIWLATQNMATGIDETAGNDKTSFTILNRGGILSYTIENLTGAQKGFIQITDITGRMVKSENISIDNEVKTTGEFNIPSLKNGIYICCLVIDNKMVAKQKLVAGTSL